jgi:hypothetical protein
MKQMLKLNRQNISPAQMQKIRGGILVGSTSVAVGGITSDLSSNGCGISYACTCGCGCLYEGSGGATEMQNASANRAGGKFSSSNVIAWCDGEWVDKFDFD